MADYQELSTTMAGIRARANCDTGNEVVIEVVTTPGPIDPPHRYRCPISGELMEDPVVAADGHTYERAFVEEWFRRGHLTSPLTGAVINSDLLTPNQSMRALIVEFVEENPSVRKGERGWGIRKGRRRSRRLSALRNHYIGKTEEYHLRLSGQHAVVAMREEIERLQSLNSSLQDTVTALQMQIAEYTSSADDFDEDEEFFGFPDEEF